MWGTTSSCDELTDDFGGAFEATSIDGCRLFCRLAEIWPYGVLGLLQHYRHEPDIAVLSPHVRCWGVKGLAGSRVDEPASGGCRDQSDDGKVANRAPVHAVREALGPQRSRHKTLPPVKVSSRVEQ
jgi:hypothetical protein